MGTLKLLAIFLSCTNAFSETTSADFLRLATGARPTALGEAYVALADDVHAISYNPAGLSQLTRQEAALMHHRFIEGIRQEWVGYVYPHPPLGSFAASLNHLTSGNIESFDANDIPMGSVSSTHQAFSLAWSKNWRKIFYGIQWSWIRERLADARAQAHAGDLGLLWKTPQKGLQAGLVLSHLGTKLRFDSEAFPLPRILRVGLAYRAEELLPELSGLLSLQGNFPQKEGPFPSLGLEAELYQLLKFQVGYRGGQELMSSLRLGWGLRLTRISSLASLWPEIDLEFQYAFIPKGELGSSQRLELLARWGKPTGSKSSAALPPPRDPEVSFWRYLDLGKEEVSRMNFAEAIELFEKALQIYPADPAAQRLLKKTIELREKFKNKLL
ncbi:MAG: PorV/PorQ family protein [Elusimicrobia bacterium]|nr:PorV/PorQ family protein [Elusimicrobiota bacterium]